MVSLCGRFDRNYPRPYCICADQSPLILGLDGGSADWGVILETEPLMAIDDVRVWGRPLSVVEVQKLWGNGMGDLGPNARIEMTLSWRINYQRNWF